LADEVRSCHSSENDVALDDQSVVDFVTVTSDGDVVLVMVEGRRWDGSAERIQELRNKINSYIEFVVGGDSKICIPR
jgi:hypothetical protein